MKISNAVLISGIVTILAIIIANVIATEYRIRRMQKEEEKKAENQEMVCPPCPVCSNEQS